MEPRRCEEKLRMKRHKTKNEWEQKKNKLFTITDLAESCSFIVGFFFFAEDHLKKKKKKTSSSFRVNGRRGKRKETEKEEKEVLFF